MNVLKKIVLKISSQEKKIEYYKKLGVKLGENCSIVGRVDFGSEPYLIKLGNNVRVSNNVCFVTHDGGMHVLRNLNLLKDADKFGRISVGNNVFIGMNSIIMPGVSIGDNCVIGAGSIVTKNIQDNTIACGIPARKIKTVDEYYRDNRDKVDLTKNMNAEDKKIYLLKKYNV